MRSRVLALATSVLAAGAVAAVPAASASAAPTPVFLPYSPLAGNGTYLVYAQNSGTCAKPDIAVKVRDVDATTRTLNHVVGNAKTELTSIVATSSNCADSNHLFSLSGHMLSGAFYDANGNNPVVFWWDLAKHTHGSQAVPAGDKYDGSIPGGWIYQRTVKRSQYSTQLVRAGTGGKTSAYGTYNKFNRVLTGTRGLLLVRSTGAVDGTVQSSLRYLTYGASRPVQLTPPAKKPGETKMRCLAIAATYVSCAAAANSGDVDTPYVQGLTPLDGTASVRCDAATCYDNDDLQRTTASPVGVTTLLSSGSLVTLQPDGTTATGESGGAATDNRSGFDPLTTAYGQIIVLHASGEVTAQTSVAGTQTTILSA